MNVREAFLSAVNGSSYWKYLSRPMKESLLRSIERDVLALHPPSRSVVWRFIEVRAGGVPWNVKPKTRWKFLFNNALKQLNREG